MKKNPGWHWIRFVLVVAIITVLITACGTQSVQQTSSGGSTSGGQSDGGNGDTSTSGGDGNAAQSGAEGDTSTSDGGGDVDPGSEDSEPRKSVDRGPSALVYDHSFTYNFNMGTTSLNMTTQVDGGVNFNLIQTARGIVSIPNQDEMLELPYFRLSGSGSVPVMGEFSFVADEDSCSCEFSDSIQVSISGLTQWKPNEVGNVDWKLNLQLTETWYTKPDWKCKCSEPEMSPIAKMNMEQIPAWQPEGLQEKTLEFLYHCDGMYITEEFQGQGGEGSYRWTYRRPNPIEYEFSAWPKDTYDEKLFPDGQLLCSDQQGSWGPPLDSIEPIVATWHDYP